jgi:hypothetical protein
MQFMKRWREYSLIGFAVFAITCSLPLIVSAQDRGVVLTGPELARVVPSAFYFQGQSAATQMRNSAAARFGSKRFVIAGMVDTSGYSSDIRERYQGFLITDSAITINGSDLAVGAYGFGFSNDARLKIFDLAGNEILSVETKTEPGLKRPRPLMMTSTESGIRLYSGKEYAVIAAK